MKTNQNLIRKMGEFEVTQRTQDGMFNATELLKQWNKKSGQQKQVGHYFEIQPTKEFINAVLDEENKCRYNDKISLSGIYTSKRGLMNGGTWMHPLLFIDFAMWLNPTFKVQVLKFVYDELIKYRNDAGDAYREMSSAIAKIVPKKELPVSIPKVAEAINHISFGQHEKEIRNRQGEEPMKDLVNLEKEITLLINVGHITTFGMLMEYLRNKWINKYKPAILN